MRKSEIPIPVVAAIAATRGMLGAGIGMLVANHLSPRKRNTTAWPLIAIGALSTLPLLWQVWKNMERPDNVKSESEKAFMA